MLPFPHNAAQSVVGPSSSALIGMQKNKAVVSIAASFTTLAAIVIFTLAKGLVSSEMAMLMLVALLGLYVGFGVLIAIYRFVSKLE
jgi:hypothetical protein